MAVTLLTVRSAAARLGIGYSTLKQWIYQGRVRTTQTAGGHHRIPDAEIDRLVARGSPTSRRAGKHTPTTGMIVVLSGRNRLRGFVEEVRVDGLLGQVRLRIGDQTLTAIITGDAIQELDLRRGDDAVAIIKSTEVMIARETEIPTHRPPKGGHHVRASSPRRPRRRRAKSPR
jgi:molybdopterin-binding protein